MFDKSQGMTTREETEDQKNKIKKEKSSLTKNRNISLKRGQIWGSRNLNYH